MDEKDKRGHKSSGKKDASGDAGEDDQDPISQFLAKVDWTGVQPDGTWVDVSDDSLRSELYATNQRVVELEAKLRAAGLEP